MKSNGKERRGSDKNAGRMFHRPSGGAKGTAGVLPVLLGRGFAAPGGAWRPRPTDVTFHCSRRSRQCGASLIEALVTLVFVGFFGVMIHTLTQSCLRSMRSQQARSDAQDTGHVAVSWIAADLRQAGFSAAGLAVEPIHAGGASEVAIQADFNGDGDLDDASERLRYGADADRRTLTRASGDSSPQPMIDSVVPESLRFIFRDQNGAVVEAGEGGLTAGQRAAVRRVEVSLTMEVDSGDVHLRDPIRVASSTSVVLRNAR